MRRKDREVTHIAEICNIIDCCKVFRVATSVNNVPYIIPLNFGYEYVNGAFIFYFHSANQGKKIDMLNQNDMVCIELDCGHELTPSETACSYGYNYKSVIATGKIEFVDDIADKSRILSILMKHQTGKEFIFTDEQTKNVTVCKIIVTELSAKQRNNPVDKSMQ